MATNFKLTLKVIERKTERKCLFGFGNKRMDQPIYTDPKIIRKIELSRWNLVFRYFNIKAPTIDENNGIYISFLSKKQLEEAYDYFSSLMIREKLLLSLSHDEIKDNHRIFESLPEICKNLKTCINTTDFANEFVLLDAVE